MENITFSRDTVFVNWIANLDRRNLFDENFTIAAVIIVKDEERCIARCLDSINDYFDEIVIIDTGSKDDTLNILDSYSNNKIMVLEKKWEDDFSYVRNESLKNVKSDWIFVIDADEYLDENSYDFKKIIAMINAYSDADKNVFCPIIIDYDGNVSISVPRIFKNNNRFKYFGRVHEELRVYEQERFSLPLKTGLNIILRHDGYKKDIIEKKEKYKRNIRLDLINVEEEPDNPRWVYFLLREAKTTLSLQEYKNYITKHILKNQNAGIVIDNINDGEYTYGLLAQYAYKCLFDGFFSVAIDMAKILDELMPNNSDSVYIENYANIATCKQLEKECLRKLVVYRKNNNNSIATDGMLHSEGNSEGKHIDYLLGCALFDTGHISRAIDYFDYLKGYFESDYLFNYYREFFSIVFGKV